MQTLIDIAMAAQGWWLREAVRARRKVRRLILADTPPPRHGKRECSRRRAQIANGRLRIENGYLPGRTA